MIKFKEIQVGSLIGKWKTEDNLYLIEKINDNKYLIYKTIFGIEKEIMTSNSLDMAKDYINKQYELIQEENSVYLIMIHGGEYSESYTRVDSVYTDLKQALNYYSQLLEYLKKLSNPEEYRKVESSFSIYNVSLVEMKTNTLDAKYKEIIECELSDSSQYRNLQIEVSIKDLNVKL